MAEFQKALKESDWKKALSLCTDEVKSKAAGYESPEGFFKDVLPIKEILSTTEFHLRGQSRRGQITRYMYPIKLQDPNAIGSLEWELYAAERGRKCSIDFETKPLKIWIKHKILEQKAANSQLRIDPNETKRGFDVRIIPLSEYFVVGKPMLFRVEMKNISNATLGYLKRTSMEHNPMIIKGPEDINVPYLETYFQIGVTHKFTEPGETVVLAENYDARSQYHIVKGGRYSFQLKGSFETKPSNIVEIDIKAGSLAAMESVVESLVPILPGGWKLMRSPAPAEQTDDSKTGESVYALLEGKRAKKGIDGDKGVNIIIVVVSGDIPIKIQPYLEEMEFWGTCKLGRIYVEQYNAEQLWLDYKQQIINALKIQPLK